MNKAFLIFKHEFLHTVKKNGFIILTFIIPAVALLGIGIFHIVSGINMPPAEITKIGYVDDIGSFDQFTSQKNVTLISYDTAKSATRALITKDIKEYFVIPSDYTSKGIITRYTLEKQITVPPEIQTAIKEFLSNNLLADKFPITTIKIIESPLNLTTIRLTATGEMSPDQGGPINLIIPGIFGMLLALSLTFSSSYVLQGLGEEKENRLMEILLSSVSTKQLMIGKVLGIGAAGLVQVVVWLISLPLLLNLASSSIKGPIGMMQIPIGFLALGVVYFILGYLLFAVLSAAIAAVSSTVREAQGLAAMFTLFPIAPFWFFSLLITFPNSPVWIVFSIFPFSAPVLVMLRFGIVTVPVWQLVVSIVVMILSVVGGLLLTAKLLRIYILMYGKRPSLKEIIHNLRSK